MAECVVFDFILRLIGAMALCGMGFFFFMLGYEVLYDFIKKLKWQYKYKHRFDKPPLAKCYCKDCRSYFEETGDCAAHTGWKVADNWFCWCAEPRKHDPENE